MLSNAPMIDIFIPLTSEECAERDRLDAEMDENEDSAVTYIRDLKAYRDKMLWRGTFKRFEEYLATRRKRYSRQRFGQLVNQIHVLDALSSQQGVDVLPENERQTRELLALSDPAEQVASCLGAQVASGEGLPSYSLVKSGVVSGIEAR